MIRIGICDDEKHYRETIREYCVGYFGERGLEYQCKEYSSGEELLQDARMDILFLDVEMAGIDGIQVKDFFQKERTETKIIFISSHEEAMADAFGRHVYGFLKKPLVCANFEKKLDVVVAELEEENRFVLSDLFGEMNKILIRRIMYIQAEGKYTKIFLENQEDYVFSDKNLGTWKTELGEEDFGICHRSYLVNFYYIKKIQDAEVLVGDVRIPLSRRMEKEFKENYRKYIWRKAK